MNQQLHDLVAPYALDALEPADHDAFERHLDECADCQEQLADLQEATIALAYGESTEPPAGLRERILEAARSENGAKIIQFPRRRWLLPVTAAAAAAAAVVAIGVGLWANSLSRDLDRQRSANAELSDISQILGGDAKVVKIRGAQGGLLVDDDGAAALVVCGLEAAPKGKTYEAWVIKDRTYRPAGLFRGGTAGCAPILLDQPVSVDEQVGVTLEQGGGAPQPTGRVLVRSESV